VDIHEYTYLIDMNAIMAKIPDVVKK